MHSKVILFLSVAMFALTLSVYSQKDDRSKLVRAFDKATEYYRKGDNVAAMKNLNDILETDSSFIDAWLLKADIYNDGNEVEKAVISYKKAISLDSAYYLPAYYILANLQFKNEMFKEAKENYIIYLNTKPKSLIETKRCVTNIPLCDLRARLIADAVPFKPENLGSMINSDGYEYVNSISLDDSLLFFTQKGVTAGSNESFFISHKTGDTWQKGIEIGEPVNSSGNEGALSMSPDGMSIYITCCSRPDSYGTCDIYRSVRAGQGWTEPMNLGGEVNSTAWDSQPSMSADGKTLYFVSARRGVRGGSDIFKTELQSNGYWGIPVNLGDSINTDADEMAPFIHPDGRTLYFSSKGHPGMGGADLFISRMDVQGNWSRPVNLGYPINTKGDEINLVIDARGKFAYISTDRKGGYGAMDIYKFELPAASRPTPVSYVKGFVFDKNDRHPLAASFELIDLADGTTVVSSVSDRTKGDFLLCLPEGKNYALNVSCEGYLFHSENFTMSGNATESEPQRLDIAMQPVKVGETVVLKNIFFDSDSYILKQESLIELEKLLQFLIKNPNIAIQLLGHTDNVGSDQHNLELSTNRAKAVYDYLLSKGINAQRLSFKGYGESIPIDSNDTEAGRANNRRTEFRISGN